MLFQPILTSMAAKEIGSFSLLGESIIMTRQYTTKQFEGRGSPVLPSPLTERRKATNDTWKLPAQRELIFLWAIQGSGASGVYGLDLQRAINECSQGCETVSYGTLYSTLKRLKGKGWVDSYEGEAFGGGAKRQYYFLTDSGRDLLNAVTQFFFDLQHWRPVRSDAN
ncbi:PadR family transcriptional regulator [Leptolyngbyaceae cyanobacterium CCMR0082]|uniref:PadR family transcriptional regulator n=1 Tax=Adonisia turfae CCMR0082 TaxID=2304604 RepID=A0A6M0SAM5_9CYAN|nr:PadR family transcriptional regulator [Adonisia turfae CCMR0082]